MYLQYPGIGIQPESKMLRRSIVHMFPPCLVPPAMQILVAGAMVPTQTVIRHNSHFCWAGTQSAGMGWKGGGGCATHGGSINYPPGLLSVFQRGYRKEPCASSATLPKNTWAGGDRKELSPAGGQTQTEGSSDCRAGGRTAPL